MAVTATEISTSRKYVGKNETTYIATQVYAVQWAATGGKHADLDTFETAAWQSTFTINSHKMYARQINIQHNWPEHPGHDRLEVTYASDFNPAKYPVGKATMEIRANPRTERLKQDLTTPTKKMIEGEDPTAVDELWKVVGGVNEVPRPATTLVVKTALLRSTLTWNTTEAQIGTVNSGACANMLGASAGTLLLWDVVIPEWYLYRDDSTAEYVPVEYIFKYNRVGWNAQLRTQRYFRKAVYLPVFATDADVYASTPNYVKRDDPTTTTTTLADALKRSYIKTVPDIAGGIKSDRIMALTSDFSTINGWLSWTV